VPPGGWQAPPSASQPAWIGKPLAGWGSRVGATLLDSLILLIPVGALTALVVAIALSGSGVGAFLVGLISTAAFLVALLFYAPVLMARSGARNGQTWGKQLVGIAVVRDSGQPVDLGFAFLREFVVKGLLFWVGGSFLLYLPTLLDYLWPLWDDSNRCLHDMVVSTHVVRR
jgi:uncharacterized RDD family membrane protein YckC